MHTPSSIRHNPGSHFGLGHLLSRAYAAWIVFALGFVLSLVAGGLAQKLAEEETRDQLNDLVVAAQAAVEHRIYAHADVLEGVRALFLASGTVNRATFGRYVVSLELETSAPGIKAMTFIRRAPAARGSAEAERYLIEYVEPAARNQHLLGYDLGADPSRLPALDRARDSGRITASAGQVGLLADADRRTDFAFRLAVYRNGKPHATVAERRANLVGLVGAIVSVEDLFRGTMSAQVLQQMRLQIYDAGPERVAQTGLVQPGKLIFDSTGPVGVAGGLPQSAEDGMPELRRSADIEVGGRTWVLQFTPRAGFRHQIDSLFAWLVFLGGLVTSALLAGLVAAMSGVQRRALTLAEGMTHQLRQSETGLAEAQHMAQLGNWSYDFDQRRVECSEEASHLIGISPAAPAPSYARCLRRVHQRDRRAFQALVATAARQGRGFETELRMVNIDGKIRWLILRGLPMVNESAQVRLVRGTIMDVTERKHAELRRTLEHNLTRQLAEADTLAVVTPRIIEAICLTMDWDCGARWSWDAGSASFACHETWSVDRPGAKAFIAYTRNSDFVPSASGLLRRVVDSGGPICIPDLTRDEGALRAPVALRSGLRGTFAFPILSVGAVLGAMEFFSHDACETDEALLAVLQAIGIQMGLFCRRKEAEEARRDTEERLHGIVNVAVEAIIAVDQQFRIVLFNPSAEKMFGTTAKEAIGSSIERVIPGRLHEIHRHHVDRFVKGGQSVRKMGEAMEVWGLRADGEEFPVEASISRMMHAGKSLYSVILNDITTRKRDEERLKFLANYDQLTALPNRSLFNQRLERALAHAQRFNKGLAVLFLDLDRFKNINDTLGHEAGDSVLKEVAARLMGCVREIDTVARLGGDEFVVLIEQVTEVRQAGSVAHKLIRTMAEPLLQGGHECSVTASVGISTYPADGDDGATLLKNADIAMYRAKEQGKNNVQFYTPTMNIHSLQRLTLESGLRRALQREEFVLHYQPKVNIASGRVTGMEALVRWKRPESGMVSPAEFIPLAEETGLIVAIGEWVLKAACEYTQAWHREGVPPLRVAVNLSARQFAQASLVSDVARILDMTGLQPAALDLEITESMVMGNPEQAIQTLRQLKSMGISLSIDDFGTGYSSLGYLKRFPLDHIKIDRSFIKDIPEDNDDATITRTIIAMAHNLRLKVIAEGVETEAQLNFLREHGCDEIQGYYFSRPLPADEFTALLKARDGKAALAA